YAVDIHAVTITVVDGLSVTELVVHMTGADIVAADEAAVEDDTMAIEADTGAVLAGDDTVGLVDDDGVGDADAVCDGVIHGGAVESDAVGVDVGNQLFCADQVGICSFADWVTAINAMACTGDGAVVDDDDMAVGTTFIAVIDGHAVASLGRAVTVVRVVAGIIFIEIVRAGSIDRAAREYLAVVGHHHVAAKLDGCCRI